MLAVDREAVSPEEIRRARRGYYGAVSLVDDHVGALMGALAEHGLTDDTILVFTSDHGDMLGERGLWYKMAPFEDSIRVPLIVHAPSRFRPRRVAEPVSLLDLLPTLVDLAGGTESPPESDGTSLRPTLEGDGLPVREIPLEYLAEGVRAPQVSLVRGPLKAVRSLDGPDLVYDVDRDPHERTNLAGTPEAAELTRLAESRWDLRRLDGDVRSSQERRRLVARALSTGTLTAWDLPTSNLDGPYIRSGQDFWATLESRRRA
jgi:choline-sulfatase